MSSNIRLIDTCFQQIEKTVAVYLLEAADGLVLIETGPGTVIPQVVDTLNSWGYRPGDVKHALVTHIHLDHAGAAGWWAKQGAHIYVHPIGARHLLDPSRLMASAQRIYGDKMDKLWGEMLPIPAEQLSTLADGQLVDFGTFQLEALDTPGHANHHLSYKVGEVAFTGDVTGVSIEGAPFVDLPAPPPEFEREIWQNSLQRLLSLNLKTLYPTHFGPLSQVSAHIHALSRVIDEGTEFIKSQLDLGLSRDEIVERYLERWRADKLTAGLTPAELHQYELANPPIMSVDGVLRYWQKKGDGRG